jgi:hypothetical protein
MFSSRQVILTGQFNNCLKRRTIMRKRQNLQISFFILILLSSFVIAAIAAEKAKSYRLEVDRSFQVAGKTLEPGNYTFKVVLGDNQKAQVTILINGQTLVQFDAQLETQSTTNEDGGIRVVLPDGKTRVLQKIWFQGTKYLLLVEKTSGSSAIASR